MKIGWDISHGEFTIEDQYHFSKLKEYAEKKGATIEEVKDFQDLEEFDVLVFNYPERFFKNYEVLYLKKWLEKGKRAIFTTYCNNMDSVADIVNDAIQKIYPNLQINHDIIVDPVHNFGREFLVKAKYKGCVVVLPCSASIKASEHIVETFESAKTYPTGHKKPVPAAKIKVGKGELIIIGTCVFWDNFSIDIEHNKLFALEILNIYK